MAFVDFSLADAGCDRLALELRDAASPLLAHRDDVIVAVVLRSDRFESAHEQARRLQHASGWTGFAGGDASGVGDHRVGPSRWVVAVQQFCGSLPPKPIAFLPGAAWEMDYTDVVVEQQRAVDVERIGEARDLQDRKGGERPICAVEIFRLRIEAMLLPRVLERDSTSESAPDDRALAGLDMRGVAH